MEPAPLEYQISNFLPWGIVLLAKAGMLLKILEPYETRSTLLNKVLSVITYPEIALPEYIVHHVNDQRMEAFEDFVGLDRSVDETNLVSLQSFLRAINAIKSPEVVIDPADEGERYIPTPRAWG